MSVKSKVASKTVSPRQQKLEKNNGVQYAPNVVSAKFVTEIFRLALLKRHVDDGQQFSEFSAKFRSVTRRKVRTDGGCYQQFVLVHNQQKIVVIVRYIEFYEVL